MRSQHLPLHTERKQKVLPVSFALFGGAHPADASAAATPLPAAPGKHLAAPLSIHVHWWRHLMHRYTGTDA